MAATKVRAMCAKCGTKRAIVKSYCKACAKELSVQPTALKPERKRVRIEDIDTERSHQVRQSTYKDTVDAYAEAMKEGDEFPPVVLFEDLKGTLWLADGWHRVEAAILCDREEIEADVYRGNADDAVDFAFRANAANQPRPMTKADKRHAVELAISLPKYQDLSDRQIANLVGCGHDMVGRLRKEKLALNATAHPEGGVCSEHTAHPEGGEQTAPKPPPDDEKDADAARTVDRSEADAEPPDDGSQPEATHGMNGAANGTAAPRKKKAPAKPDEDKEDDDPPSVQLDAYGIPVQPHARAAFAAVGKFRELVAAISHAKKLFNEVANLPGGKFLTLPDVSSYLRGKKDDEGNPADRFTHPGLERAYQQCKAATPTLTLCPWTFTEKGHPEDCKTCLGLNWTPVLGSNVPPACIDKAKEACAAK